MPVYLHERLSHLFVERYTVILLSINCMSPTVEFPAANFHIQWTFNEGFRIARVLGVLSCVSTEERLSQADLGSGKPIQGFLHL